MIDRIVWHRMSLLGSLAYFAGVLVAAALTFATAEAWQNRIAGCTSYGYGVGAYLGSCSSPTYGDYEHGAIAFQLEPAAVRALKAADVVYFGFSYGMVALSSDATDEYFHRVGAHFFNLGFSGEFSSFYDDILPMLDLHPRVVVIDVEPFFTPLSSAVRTYIHDHPQRAAIEYVIKRGWQRLQRRTCTTESSVMYPWCGSTFAYFRNTETGRIIINYAAVYGTPLQRIPAIRNKPALPAAVQSATALAAAFLGRHALDPGCVIMFAAPNSYSNQAIASGVAHGVDAQYVDVDLPNLATVDTGHLGPDDAERWSAAFWNAANPVITRCVSTPKSTLSGTQ